MTTVAPSPWPAEELPELPPGGVHVWTLALDGVPATDLLTPAERERAAGYAREEAGRRWARGRAELRRILAAYTGADPRELAIEASACVHCGEAHGKPVLAGPDGGWLRFSVSHSGDLAAIAVANGREVGVDVEAAREGRRMQQIADRWFSEAESAALRSLSGGERDATFYRLWARKEAYLKATAQGVFGEPVAFDALGAAPEGWELADLDVGVGYAAALAVAPPGFRPGA